MRFLCVIFYFAVRFAGASFAAPPHGSHRLYQETLKNRPNDHLGRLCEEMAAIVPNHPATCRDTRNGDNSQPVILPNGEMMYRQSLTQSSEPGVYNLKVTGVLSNGSKSVTTVAYLTDRYIKIVETTSMQKQGQTNEYIVNERIIQFGYGSAPETLALLATRIKDKKVAKNFLAKIAHWYPEAHIHGLSKK